MVISEASIPISNPFFKSMALGKVAVKLGEAKALNGKIYYYVFILVAVLLISAYVLKCTKFGRSVYALGGNETSADLMGLNVARTKISAYAISSFCAALGGVVFSVYTLAGYGLQNMGMELDALSSAVIGGTLLTGGVGTVVGTTVGAMIQGIIQTIVTYQNLNTWWTKVTIAALLLLLYCNSKNHSNSRRKIKRKGRGIKASCKAGQKSGILIFTVSLSKADLQHTEV